MGRFSIPTVSQDFSFYQPDQKPTLRKKPAQQLIRWLTIQSLSSADCAFFSFPCDPKLFCHQWNRIPVDPTAAGLGVDPRAWRRRQKSKCGFSGAICRNRWNLNVIFPKVIFQQGLTPCYMIPIWPCYWRGESPCPFAQSTWVACFVSHSCWWFEHSFLEFSG